MTLVIKGKTANFFWWLSRNISSSGFNILMLLVGRSLYFSQINFPSLPNLQMTTLPPFFSLTKTYELLTALEQYNNFYEALIVNYVFYLSYNNICLISYYCRNNNNGIGHYHLLHYTVWMSTCWMLHNFIWSSHSLL